MADITGASGVITALGIFVDFGTEAVPDVQYLCAVDARAHQITFGETTTPVVEVCGPGAPISTWRALSETSWQVTGSGAMELETFDLMRAWRDSKADRRTYIVYYSGPKTALVAHGYYAGPGLLREYSAEQANADAIPTASITIENGAGSASWTAGAPSFAG